MKEISRKINFPIGLAIILHIALLFFLFFNVSGKAYRLQAHANAQTIKPIQVKAVTQAELTSEINAIKKARYDKRMAKVRREKRRREKALALKHQRMLKAKRLAMLKAKKKRAALKKAKEKKLRQKKEKLLLAKQQLLQQKILKQQMQHEQQTLKQIDDQQMQGEINQYKAEILSVIRSHWRIAQVNKHIRCTYAVDVAPGGMVLSIKLLKSSGSAMLDHSAKVAILKSSPLPVPDDSALFDQFRHLVLTLSPQGYV